MFNSNRERCLVSAPVHGWLVETGVRLVADDGIELATDIYRPANDGQLAEGPFPTILERTPYGRDRLDFHRMGRFFASRGYNVVVQDCRGRYGSGGEFAFFYGEHEGRDGAATARWIARQEWSDGQVGTTGLSFSGSNQQAHAVTDATHLATQFVMDAGINYWRRTARHDGVFTAVPSFVYALTMALDGKEAQADPAARRAIRRALDEVPAWVSRFPLARGSSPLALAPSYEDWYLRQAEGSSYSDGWSTNPLTSFEEFVDDYPDIPVCFVTSWYGHHALANFEKLDHLRGRSAPAYLISGTWLHRAEYMSERAAGEVDFGNAASLDLNEVRLRWFDQWMKGGAPAFDDEQRIRYFVMGGGSGSTTLHGERLDHGGRWRSATTWPPPGTTTVRWYLGADGNLLSTPADEVGRALHLLHDPDRPVPTIGAALVASTGSRALFVEGGADQRDRPSLPLGRHDSLPLSARPDVLTFRSPVLTEPLEVSGYVTVELFISSSSTETDFTAKLIDEYPPCAEWPDGFALNLCDGIVRTSFRESRQSPELIEPGVIYRVRVGPMVTANVFAVGHRLRLDIASSNFPQFEVCRGVNSGITSAGTSVVNSIYLDAARASHILIDVRTSDVVPGQLSQSKENHEA